MRWMTIGMILAGCAGADSTQPPAPTPDGGAPVEVVAVDVSGSGDSVVFATTLLSEETGCDAYADWWEVVTLDGELIHRRILDHSHPNEQPFTRSGAPFSLDEGTVVVVRGHMNVGGYGTKALQGTMDALAPVTLDLGWADDLGTKSPLPDGCAF